MAETVTDALYTKCPLPPQPGHIRLLRLHPSLDHSAPLSGTIFATTLEASRASYEALSYCWGDNARPGTISLHVQTWVTRGTLANVAGSRAFAVERQVEKARPRARRRAAGNEEPLAGQSHPNKDTITIPITRSLAEALADLRFPSSDRLLWVDALCIDQAHNGEKSIQVRQMYDVYANSLRTLVYLGRDSAEGMQAAIAHRDYLRAVNAGGNTSVGSVQASDTGTLVTWDPAVGVVRAGKGSPTVSGKPDCHDYRTAATLPNTDDDVLFYHVPDIVDSWKCILDRQWTTRAWTTQEFVAGPDVLMQLGQGEVNLTLRDLSNLARYMGYEPRSDERIGEWGSSQYYYASLTAKDMVASKIFRMIRIRTHMSERALGIGGVLWRIKNDSHVDVLKTRDARDVLWSLLALSRRSASALELQPDYDLSIDEVYRRFSIHMATIELKALTELPLLMQTGTPSWRLATAFNGYEYPRLYYAQKSIRELTPVTANEQGTELTMQGVLVDRIHRLIKPSTEVDAQWVADLAYGSLLSVTTTYNNLQEAASWPGVFTLPEESPREAAFKLFRGFTPDTSEETGHSRQPVFNANWDEYGHLYFVARLSAYLEDLDPTNYDFFNLVRKKGWPMDMVRQYLPRNAGGPPRFPVPEELTTPAECFRAGDMFFQTAFAHSIGSSLPYWRCKTVGMTGRGHLCNLDPEARVGDWIAVTANSPLALILREGQGGAYSLVGKAYAHGLLEGMEMYGDVEEEIRLC